MKPTIKERQAAFGSCTTEGKTNVVQLPMKGSTLPPGDATPSDAPTDSTAPTTPLPEAGAPATGRGQLNDLDDETVDKKADAARRLGQTLATLSTEFNPFVDQTGNFYIAHDGNSVPLESTAGIDIIRTVAFEKSNGRIITKANLEAIQTMLRNAATAKGVRTLYRRIGKLVHADGTTSYLLDLGDADRQGVRIDSHGVHPESMRDLDVAFSRGPRYAALPEPKVPATAVEAWAAVQPLLQGLPAHVHFALIAAKVEHLRCDSPHPVLEFLGPEGSGKTTVARHNIIVIDPVTGHLPSVATDGPSITAAAQRRHSLLIDNVGGALDGEVQNLLCRGSYGVGTSQRKYYTQDEMSVDTHNAWHLTAIVPSIRQSDLLDRALVMEVTRPPGYEAESVVEAEFAERHPYVLGGLLWFLSERMRRAPTIEKTQKMPHRMVDWAVTGEAILQSLGRTPGEFIKAQTAARAAAASECIEGDTFAQPLVEWLNDFAKGAQVASMPAKRAWGKVLPWTGIVAGQRVVIATADHVREAMHGRQTYNAPQPPRTARATTGAITRVQGLLTKAGWYVTRTQWNGRSNSAWVFGAPK